LQRWAGPGIVALIGFGFDVADFFGSSLLAYSAWGIAGAWVAYLVWPWLKRWRPFTLAPTEAELARRWEQERFGKPTIENKPPKVSQDFELQEELEQLREDKRTLEKKLEETRSRGSGAGQADSALTVAQIVAERDRLREELESSKANTRARGKFAYDQNEIVKALREENAQAITQLREKREELNRVTPKKKLLEAKVAHWDNRRLLKRALVEAREKGVQLSRANISEKDAKPWVTRTRKLIQAALGQERAQHFIKARYESAMTSNPTKGQIWVDGCLKELDEIIGLVDSVEPLDLQPGFDGREWVSKK
jgi:hypothetical protein